MAIISSVLQSELISNVRSDESNDSSAQTRLWSTIKSYMIDNLQLNGVYTGVIPGAPPVPDPANGPHTWKVRTIYAPDSLLKDPSTFDSWIGLLRQGLASIMFQSTSEDTLVTVADTLVTVAGEVNIDAPATLVTVAGASMLTSPSIYITTLDDTGTGSFERQMGRLAGSIVNGVVSVPVNPVSLAATSTFGGTGNVVFSNCV